MAAGPIVAFHFQQVSPWAAVASVALAPVVFFAIVVAGMKVVLTAAIPWGAGVWAWGAGWAARALSGSVEGMAGIPAGDVGVAALPGWAAILGVVCLCLPMWGGVRRWGEAQRSAGVRTDEAAAERGARRGRRVRAAAWGVGLVATVGMPLLPLWAVDGVEGMRMTVLSVGSAQSIVVDGAAVAGGAIVIDAGSNGGDVYRRIVEPFLRASGVRRVRTLVLTHPDSDHTSGAELLIRRRGVGELVVGEGLMAAVGRDGGGPAGRAVAAAREVGVPVRVVAEGDVIEAGAVLIDVVHPERDGWRGMSENDGSLVLRVGFAGRVVVVGSDVEEVGQRAVLRQGAMVRGDVLIAPHHGSWETTLLPLIRATEAGVVVVSDDATPSGRQAKFHREMARETGVKMLRTSEWGAVRVVVGADGTVEVRGFRGGK